MARMDCYLMSGKLQGFTAKTHPSKKPLQLDILALDNPWSSTTARTARAPNASAADANPTLRGAS